MGAYVVRRILQMIPVVIGATFIIYAMVFSLPGDPTAALCGDRGCPPALQQEIAEKYHLDDNVFTAYGKYAAALAQGDFGDNVRGNPVSADLIDRYPVTAKLAVMALAIEAVIGILAGALAALRKNGFLDNVILVSTLLLISTPIFVVGGLSQYFFGVKLGIFPVTVSRDAGIYDLLMPALVLGSASVAYVARLTRTNLAENLRADYVRTAKAKGLTPRRAIGLHALRNSLIPVVTFIGYDFGALLGGAIITERIFNIRGVGGYIFQGINQRDGFAVVGAVTALVIVYLIVNLVVDLLYGVLDPRIAHD